MVKAGDPIPSVELEEGGPGAKINLAEKLAKGKGVIVGVPAAYSPTCSDSHIPAYVASPNAKKQPIYVVSVNDAFVMKAWGKTLDADGSSGVHFAADATGAFSKALDLLFDATPLLGNERSKRYAIVTEDGKVKSVHVEDDPSKVTVSGADTVIA